MARDALSDPVFGQLRGEDAYGWWVGSFEFQPGNLVEVVIYGDDPRVALEVSHTTLACVRQHEPALRQAIARRLLEKYAGRNDGLHLESVTAETLAEGMELESLQFAEDSTVQLGYSDGGVFANHIILADVGADGELEHAFIAG